jgi:hypothetical protein
MESRHLIIAGSALVICVGPAVPAWAGGIFADTFMLSRTFADAAELEGTRMGLAWDGTNYWSSSGGSSGGLRLAQYGSDGALLNTYSPGLNFRSIFTAGSEGPLYAREFGNSQIYAQISPGQFTNDVSLSGGTLNADSSVGFLGHFNDFIAMNAGVVGRWERSGNYIGSVALNGFGTQFNEDQYPQNRSLYERWNELPVGFTYSEGHVSGWDLTTGNRVGTALLPAAGQSFDSYSSFSVTEGMIWVLDKPGGVWKGYDIRVIPQPGAFVIFAAGAFARRRCR